MARVFMVLFFLGLVLAVLALISCLSAEEGQVRGLPRIAWVLIILLFPLLGSIGYFLAGRPEVTSASRGAWRAGGGFPESRRPSRPLAPDDDPDFLRRINQKGRREDEDLLRRWEEDLRRREDELRKGDSTAEDTPPSDS